MANFTNRTFNWDLDHLQEFYQDYVYKWIKPSMGFTSAQKTNARANLGFGNGSFDVQPTANSANMVTSGAIYGWCSVAFASMQASIDQWTGIYNTALDNLDTNLRSIIATKLPMTGSSTANVTVASLSTPNSKVNIVEMQNGAHNFGLVQSDYIITKQITHDASSTPITIPSPTEDSPILATQGWVQNVATQIEGYINQQIATRLPVGGDYSADVKAHTVLIPNGGYINVPTANVTSVVNTPKIQKPGSGRGLIVPQISGDDDQVIATEEYVQSQIGGINPFTYQVAQTLPTATVDTMYILYLVPVTSEEANNKYEEYITIDKGSGVSPRYVWEMLGTIEADLSDYAKKSDTTQSILAGDLRAVYGMSVKTGDAYSPFVSGGSSILMTADRIKSRQTGAKQINIPTVTTGNEGAETLALESSVPADVSRSATDATIVNSDHNTLFYLRQANSSLAGLMTAAEHTKLDELPTASELYTSTIYDVSANNPTAGPDNDGKFTLEYILNQNNVDTLIPTTVRRGGMSITFVHTSNNKYVQYRLTADSWSTYAANWERYNDVTTSNQPNSDLDITDDLGNVLVRIAEGHIKMKNFDSRNVGNLIENAEMDEVLGGDVAVYLTDANGNAVLDSENKPIEII